MLEHHPDTRIGSRRHVH